MCLKSLKNLVQWHHKGTQTLFLKDIWPVKCCQDCVISSLTCTQTLTCSLTLTNTLVWVCLVKRKKGWWGRRQAGKIERGFTTLKRVGIPPEPFPHLAGSCENNCLAFTLSVQMESQLWVSFQSSKWWRKWLACDLLHSKYKHAL